MKLSKVRITEFQSVKDSNEFEVGNTTCLVGKNEAGKTAILKALYRLRPVIETDGDFSVTDDYPRAEVEDYRQAVESKEREEATVVRAVYLLDDEDLEETFNLFGKGVITSRELALTKGYENKSYFNWTVNTQQGLNQLFSSAQLTPDLSAKLAKCPTPEAALTLLNGAEPSAESTRLIEILTKIEKRGSLEGYIYNELLRLDFIQFKPRQLSRKANVPKLALGN